MRISDWSSDVCSSDLAARRGDAGIGRAHQFDHVRIALVGHDRAAGGILRGQRDEAELGTGKQAQVPGQATQVEHGEIGRASWRERVCQYVEISVVAVSLKKKKQHTMEKSYA